MKISKIIFSAMIVAGFAFASSAFAEDHHDRIVEKRIEQKHDEHHPQHAVHHPGHKHHGHGHHHHHPKH